MDETTLPQRLRREILFARRRIYEVGEATPLQQLSLSDPSIELFVKREDLSPIHAYKWRGAYNRMAVLTDEERSRGVVTASAGNHAQGVALAARKLGTDAVIFMPQSTPRMKQKAVRRHGGDAVDVRLIGDTYDVAGAAARECAEKEGRNYIHAYDDLAVMAGQGTLADEIVMSGKGPFDDVFLQVGGGGMAAAAATWLKFHYPEIRVVGVEGAGQASMQAAIAAGAPVDLGKVDVFCDGTAVRKAGALTYPLCRDMVDEWVSVSNDEVSAAVQFLWEELRCIPEPSGAMGLAAALKQRESLAGRRILTVLCGANMDFEQLAGIARRAAVGAAKRRFLRIHIAERARSMLGLLEDLPESVNIVEFQYGKTHANDAWPVIGFDVSPMEFEALTGALAEAGYEFTEVTSEADVAFRLIHYEASLMSEPFFITLEFHERPGALGDFLRAVSPHANLCYFSYSYSGERVGRALLGFEFPDTEHRSGFEKVLQEAAGTYRNYERITGAALQRILG